MKAPEKRGGCAVTARSDGSGRYLRTTISVPVEVKRLMTRYQRVNWSAVAVRAFVAECERQAALATAERDFHC